jgi:DNA-binding IclR family transcriptional regulator
MEDMLNQLFDDKTVKILSILRDKKIIQIRETSRLTSIPPATVFRIFKKLSSIGLLEKESKG